MSLGELRRTETANSLEGILLSGQQVQNSDLVQTLAQSTDTLKGSIEVIVPVAQHTINTDHTFEDACETKSQFWQNDDLEPAFPAAKLEAKMLFKGEP